MISHCHTVLLPNTNVAALLVAVLHNAVDTHNPHIEAIDFIAIAMLSEVEGTAIPVAAFFLAITQGLGKSLDV